MKACPRMACSSTATEATTLTEKVKDTKSINFFKKDWNADRYHLTVRSNQVFLNLPRGHRGHGCR